MLRFYAPHVASHVALHDMVDAISLLRGTEEPDFTAKRIINIGAQSERAFYAARTACREVLHFRNPDMAKTGQIFTRHILPPYIFSNRKEREPHLLDPRGVYLNLSTLDSTEPFVVRSDSTLRDLSYLKGFIEHYAPGEEYPAPLA